ncbi:hypothetical protein P9273_03340 [Mesorhizobium sp. WSM4935]|uniref:hypothetical protein n=2 Tax=Mesorhizobium TaxID=68287 RepID=UPI0024151131|nr:hypothetical protein [Mesorhizobium sp. WSM4935]MDG4874131.1 hypothetical protein [Mesorhizobium sp. WSM4935]
MTSEPDPRNAACKGAATRSTRFGMDHMEECRACHMEVAWGLVNPSSASRRAAASYPSHQTSTRRLTMPNEVSHPPRISDLQLRIAQAQTEAKMDLLERANVSLTSQLMTIFDGISRNEQVELIYPNGEVVLITKARKRDRSEGGE